MTPRGQTPERREYMKAWHAANPRDRKAYKAAYDAVHREENKAYRDGRREIHKAQNRAWYLANREAVRARVKARADADPQRISEYQADYYAENTPRVKARVAAYREAHPEQHAHHDNARRVRKTGNGGSHTFAERVAKFALFGNRCAYCREVKPLTVDHDIPIARGGRDDIDNILPACQRCNSRKSKRTAAEFLTPYFGRTNHQRVGGAVTAVEESRGR